MPIRKLLKTDDGSYTLQLPEWDEQYHSKHGAIAEALHVFIREGYRHFLEKYSLENIAILEVGFGTGLNCFLTYLENLDSARNIQYTAVEAYPLELMEVERLNYGNLLNVPVEDYLRIHQIPWENEIPVTDSFRLLKQKKFFEEIKDEERYHLVYFDAFGIRVQPELWTENIFGKMYNSLTSGGVLVTYAANGNARRALQAVGFTVERLPGPPGKKEMMRATKS